MATTSFDFRLKNNLSIVAAVLAAGLGIWLLQRGENPLITAGVVALMSAALSLISALVRRPVSKPIAAPEPVAVPTPPPAPPTPKLDPIALADGGALRLLAKLQELGRLIDFVMEDIRTVSDAHAGCRTTLQNTFTLEPLHPAAEGSTVTLASGFDPESHRLIGHVSGLPPFTGTLLHRGWRSTAVKLPHATNPTQPHSGIVAPAEIELR
jgi:hypothetical protein